MLRKSAAQRRQPQEASSRLQARFERIQVLEDKIDALRHADRFPIGQALDSKNSARWLYRSAQEELEKGNIYGLTREQRRSLEAKVKSAEEAWLTADVAHRELIEARERQQEERRAAEAELADLTKAAGLAEVLSFQQSLAEVKERIPALKILVAEQERMIEGVKSSIPSDDHLLKRREDILAGLSTGDATESQLRAVDSERPRSLLLGFVGCV